MTDGIPYWRPPRWIDHTQTARRNTTHHLPVHLSTHRTTAASSHGAVSDIVYRTA
jgi:hypothetical protein